MFVAFWTRSNSCTVVCVLNRLIKEVAERKFRFYERGGGGVKGGCGGEGVKEGCGGEVDGGCGMLEFEFDWFKCAVRCKI